MYGKIKNRIYLLGLKLKITRENQILELKKLEIKET
jgi:hypothetical protein